MNQKNGKMAGGAVLSVLLMVGVGHMLNDTTQSVIPAIYPIIKQNYRLTFTQIGIINLVYQLTSSVLQPVVGWHIDRRKRPYMLAGGMAFNMLGLLLLSVASTFATITAAVTLVGCGSSVFHPGAARMAQLASGGHKGLAQSIFQVGGNCGTACGPLLAALIIQPLGQGSVSTFAVAALLGMLVLLRVGWWYKRQPSDLGRPAASDRAQGHSLSRRQVQRAVVMLVVLVFSKYFYMACITNYFTFYLIDAFSLTVQQAQFGLFAFLGASAVGTLVGGVVGDRYGRKLVIACSILGPAPFTLLMPHVPLVPTIALAIVIGFVISSAFSAIVVYATDLMPTRVGVISGMFYGLMFGLAGIASAVLGALADATSIRTIFVLTSGLPLLGVIALWLPNVKSN